MIPRSKENMFGSHLSVYALMTAAGIKGQESRTHRWNLGTFNGTQEGVRRQGVGSVLEPGQDLQGSCTVSPADQSQAGSFVFPRVLYIIGRTQQPILGLFVVPGMGSRALCKHLTSEPCPLPFY